MLDAALPTPPALRQAPPENMQRVAHHAHHHIDWGDFPGWIAAIGTVGSLLIALYLLWRESRRRDMEQAAQVAAYDSIESTGGTVIYVHNASTQPVNFVRLDPVAVDGRVVSKDQEWLVGAAAEEEYREAFGRAPVLGERPFTPRFLPDDGVSSRLTPGMEIHTDVPSTDCLQVIIQFTDSNGRDWCRNATTGKLYQSSWWRFKLIPRKRFWFNRGYVF